MREDDRRDPRARSAPLARAATKRAAARGSDYNTGLFLRPIPARSTIGRRYVLTGGTAILMGLANSSPGRLGARANPPLPPLAAGTVMVGSNGIVTNIIMLRSDDNKLVAYVYSLNGNMPYVVGSIPIDAKALGKCSVELSEDESSASIITPIGIISIQLRPYTFGNPYIGTMPTGEAGYRSYEKNKDGAVTFKVYTAEQWLRAEPLGGDGLT